MQYTHCFQYWKGPLVPALVGQCLGRSGKVCILHSLLSVCCVCLFPVLSVPWWDANQKRTAIKSWQGVLFNIHYSREGSYWVTFSTKKNQDWIRTKANKKLFPSRRSFITQHPGCGCPHLWVSWTVLNYTGADEFPEWRLGKDSFLTAVEPHTLHWAPQYSMALLS